MKESSTNNTTDNKYNKGNIGAHKPGTIESTGKISGEEVIILIDFGATHNFISSQMVEKLS